MAQHGTEACVKDVLSCSFGCRNWSKPKRREGRVGHVCSLYFGLNCSFTALEESMMHASPSPAYTIPEPCCACLFSSPFVMRKAKAHVRSLLVPNRHPLFGLGSRLGTIMHVLGASQNGVRPGVGPPVGLLQRRAGGDGGRTYKARHARNWARGEGTGLRAQAET